MKVIEYEGRMTQFLRESFGTGTLWGLEVGVLEGDGALRILQTLNMRKLWLVDPYEPYEGYKDHNAPGVRDAFHVAKKKLAPYADVIHWVFLKSSELPAVLNKAVTYSHHFDFGYLDHNHDYDYVYPDLWRFSGIVTPGGVLGGHDFYNRDDPDNLCGVKRAVEQFVEEHGLQLYIDVSYEYPWPDWWFIVTPELWDKVRTMSEEVNDRE